MQGKNPVWFIKKKVYVLLHILLIFLLTPLVYSVAPVTTIFTGDTGINVEVNSMAYYKQGEARWSVIFLFNASDGSIITNTTDNNITCKNHLRDSQGFEIGEQRAVVHDDHWDINGSAGADNPIGQYAWTIHCIDENSKTGGYASGFFEINEGGNAPVNILPIIIGLFFVVIMFSIAGYYNKGITIQNLGLRVLCYGVALAELLNIVFLLYANSTGNLFNGILKVNFLIMLVLFFGIAMISLIWLTLRMIVPGDKTIIDEEDKKW